MLLYFLDNALLLHLTLEAPKGAFNRFTVEYPNFCQCLLPPYLWGRKESMGSMLKMFKLIP